MIFMKNSVHYKYDEQVCIVKYQTIKCSLFLLYDISTTSYT